jgi:small-conductance mechanosensitive channel
VLWMVLTITLSGVVLAGLQLLAAYRLATAGRGEFAQQQEITLEQNRISLKSSVTGLLILVVSFAFFMVYVAWVFAIREASLVQSQNTRGPTTQLLPGLGGPGPPPQNEPAAHK